jgi:RsiW-degrading membrane proteinase PrsW (M82 family)
VKARHTSDTLNIDLLLRAPIALLPVILFLTELEQLDGYKLVRLRVMLTLVAAGALAAGASYLANGFAYAHFPWDFQAYSRYVAPWIEESLKAVLLIFLIRTRRVGLPVDAGIAGFAIGTGFALIENLYYLASRPEAALPVQVIRGFGTAIMHGGTATVLAMISITLYESRPNGGLQLLLPGFLAAVALHSGFNYLLGRPALATLATLLVLPLVIYLVFRHSERTLRDWLDADLDSNVQLLESINTGRFLDSNPGRYLRSLRERFRSEDLADMLCCLRLHGELALRAKGILLLRESGMDEPPLDAETRDKLAELAHLERAIGKAGMLALRPLMMATGKDIWQLTLLGE